MSSKPYPTLFDSSTPRSDVLNRTLQDYDERLGWHETTISRKAVRDELDNRLSRSFSDRPVETPSADPDTFCVKPVHQF